MDDKPQKKTVKSQPAIPDSVDSGMEIDLVALMQKVWHERKLIVKWVAIAMVIALIVAFSIPKEYETTVTLAPESGKVANPGGLGALGSLVGANLGATSGTDALSPALFPDIVHTTPFLVGLFDVPVQDLKKSLPDTLQLYDYMAEEQRAAWWGYVFSMPFRVLGWVMSIGKDKEPETTARVDAFQLTLKQSNVAKALANRIVVVLDKKTSVTSVTVTMQDPLVAATLADTVTTRLKAYITEYRTNKARNDLAYAELLFKEAQQNYYAAQNAYAKLADKNLGVANLSYQSELDRVRNERDLTFSVYNHVAQQLQAAKAKVQEETPVFAVVQPATVSVRAASPRKLMILIGFMFLAGVMAVGWVLFGRDLVQSFKKPCND